jgi:D-2-hydroxyacid dehydrogenase (NADP+)
VISSDKSVSSMFERAYASGRGELIEAVPSADVLFSFAVPEEAILKADNLKWLHFASAGVEKSIGPALASRKIKVTCSRGIHAKTIAEYVMMQVLAFSKNLPKALEFQSAHKWSFEELLPGKFDLEGKTIAIIGLGSIGRRVARIARAFDMRVIGTVNKLRRIGSVDRVYPASGMDKCIALADFVVLSAPLTESTYHLMGEKQFDIMKQDAFLINIGRGKLIDEAALVSALRSRKIAGAALDVFEIEPLPADSPLWDMDNVNITPHYSGMAEDLWEKVARLFCENAKRFRSCKRMLGIVNIQEGY